ncbi:MAG: heat-inducible transcription repressor HrcA [Actinomycetota bacterium]
MLDERKTAILKAVVQEYVATGLPVGSTHIATLPSVKVSSATVRNEMAVLEQEGYLAQPHTSAGRIPTDKGYRHFVDSITPQGVLAAEEASQVGDFFKGTHGRLEDLLRHTTTLLANREDNSAGSAHQSCDASFSNSCCGALESQCGKRNHSNVGRHLR